MHRLVGLPETPPAGCPFDALFTASAEARACLENIALFRWGEGGLNWTDLTGSPPSPFELAAMKALRKSQAAVRDADAEVEKARRRQGGDDTTENP